MLSILGLDMQLLAMLAFLGCEHMLGRDLLEGTARKVLLMVVVLVFVVRMLPTWASYGHGMHSAVRTKRTEGGQAPLLEWASSEMQGWRQSMEDAHAVLCSMPDPLASQALFAVFDGHGGSKVASVASNELPKVVAAEASSLMNKAQAGSEDESGKVTASIIEKSLHLSMLSLDAALRKGGAEGVSGGGGPSPPIDPWLREAAGKSNNAFSLMGSTAIVAVLDCTDESKSVPRRLTVANCGDSRAVLCRRGQCIDLSEDHKPERPCEEDRIRRAGGHVVRAGVCHRIDGWGLNLSRALGDFHYKARDDLPPDQQKVIAVPEILTLELTAEDEFLVLGCDGIFELLSSQKVVDTVRKQFREGKSTTEVVEHLLDQACSRNLIQTRGRGGDNCSAIVVRFRRDSVE
mmetsp:Transcript_18679/g.33749  ORF Transcript_18679/g.33749 Transcript_18679/m.33749 type:complete len:404 (+) Transcript_18679:93-1304(+)